MKNLDTQKHYFINSTLSKELITIPFSLNNIDLSLKSDAGIFSAMKVDFGTELLLKSIDYISKKTILDIGTGYGVMGLYLAKLYPASFVTMIDINDKAITLAKMNAQNNKISNVFIALYDAKNDLSKAYETKKKYDLIVMNPPIKAGKGEFFTIIKNTVFILNKVSGVLLIVSKKNQGALSTKTFLESLFFKVEIINRKSGYYVIAAKRPKSNISIF